MNATPTPAGFARHWSMVRDIVHVDGLKGRLTGTAIVAPAGPDRLTYDEAGTLTLGASDPVHATRRYLWRVAGGAIDVSFPDGRPFHRIDLSVPRPATVHLCNADRYAVAYDFSAWPEWRAQWRVEGPRKDYEMTTIYRPLR